MRGILLCQKQLLDRNVNYLAKWKCECIFFDELAHSKTNVKQFVEQYENALRNKVKKKIWADVDSFSK